MFNGGHKLKHIDQAEDSQAEAEYYMFNVRVGVPLPYNQSCMTDDDYNYH